MSRRKPEARCPHCVLRREHCLCAEIAELRNSLEVSTRLLLVMHHREIRLPTNTGRLAAAVLKDSQIALRGVPGESNDLGAAIGEGRQGLFLYPGEGARPLTRENLASLRGPFTLVVPDGSWRQASKVAKREAALKDLPIFVLPEGEATEYRLRREPKAGGLATFEAIARCLGILEGPEVQRRLERLFREMVRRTLQARGAV